MFRHRTAPDRLARAQDAATRQAAPARPRWLRGGLGTPARIAFVHIPKTAGRSVIHAFEQALGEDNCTSFSPTLDPASFDDRVFVAGHVQLSQATADAFTFTFLRDPLRQLASHLRWLDRYNLRMFWEEVLPLSDGIQRAVRRLGETDFDSARSLQAFFDWLPEDSHARLDNVQCEVLAARADIQAYHTEAEMAETAIANLGRLDFVGFAERIHHDLAALFRRLDLGCKPSVTHQNTLSSNRRINVADPAIRQVLERHVGADMLLYRHALEARGGARKGLHRALAWRRQS